MNRLVLRALICIVAVAAAVIAADKPTLAIRAGNWLNEKGELADKALVIFTGEKISQVGGDAPADLAIHEYPASAVISPGLVDCMTSLGSLGDLTERKSAIEPTARAKDAFDRFHSHLRRAMQAGVTTFALCPEESNLIGGSIAVCQTTGPRGQPRLLVERGPMMLSLSPAVYREDREPTSRSGAVGMLREALAKAATGPKEAPLTAAITAKGRFFVSSPAAADVLTAAQLLAPYKISPIVVHSEEARVVAADSAGSLTGAVVGPIDLCASPRMAEAAGRFERAGTRVAISGRLPFSSEQGLRIGAAVAARNGLKKQAARLAITQTPAEFLGVSDRVGAIKKDLLADVVVFSGDPLDLRSRVLAVYVAGERVYVAGDAAESK